MLSQQLAALQQLLDVNETIDPNNHQIKGIEFERSGAILVKQTASVLADKNINQLIGVTRIKFNGETIMLYPSIPPTYNMILREMGQTLVKSNKGYYHGLDIVVLGASLVPARNKALDITFPVGSSMQVLPAYSTEFVESVKKSVQTVRTQGTRIIREFQELATETGRLKVSFWGDQSRDSGWGLAIPKEGPISYKKKEYSTIQEMISAALEAKYTLDVYNNIEESIIINRFMNLYSAAEQAAKYREEEMNYDNLYEKFQEIYLLQNEDDEF